jgi:hypothetical protein
LIGHLAMMVGGSFSLDGQVLQPNVHHSNNHVSNFLIND